MSDEIAIRVPLILKPGGYFGYKNKATRKKYYLARILVGMPSEGRLLGHRFGTASQALDYGKAVCDRYYSLWRAEKEVGK